MLIQQTKHTIRPLTTAHLAQTMSLLALSGEELRQKLEAELAANPALEVKEERRCPHCNRLLGGNRVCPVCSLPDRPASQDPIIFVSPQQDFHMPKDYSSSDDTPIDEWTSAGEDLPTYVLRQIALELDPDDRQLAAHILTSLDDDGLMTTTVMEIARYHHVPPSRVIHVLSLIQRADPVGVGSPTAQAALLVQLDVLSETRPVPPLAARAIEEGLNLLSRRAYTELARQLDTTVDEVKKVASFIGKNLNPYPARAHWGNAVSAAPPIQPYKNADIIIRLLHDTAETPLVVEVISPYAGALRVNPMFRKALAHAPTEKLEQWQSDLEQASLLVKCLQQREHTLVRLMKKLVKIQRQFILHGDAHIYPITRAQLADDLDVHESTISRAVATKTVELPNKRIIPLSKMFDRSLHIRTALKQLIAKESKPLSDKQLTTMLQDQGFPVARRTVAKYRSMEGILPARLRKAQTGYPLQ